MKALVIGSTGASGSQVVAALLSNPQVTAVHTFVRCAQQSDNPKLTQHVINFDNITQYQDLLRGDALFNCMGTTLKQAGSKAAQSNIDVEIPYNVAAACRQNNVNTCISISALGANNKSLLFYNRIKGELEDKLQSLHFPHLVIFRPGMLYRYENPRPAEKITYSVLSGLNKIGLLKKYRPLPVDVLADKMVTAALQPAGPYTVVEGYKIFTYPH